MNDKTIRYMQVAPGIYMLVPHRTYSTWPALAYLKWKTAVPFKRDTTLRGNGKPAQVVVSR